MTEEVLDRAVITDLQEMMGPEFAAELITTFLEEGPVMLNDLAQAESGGDAEAFRRAAHSIKSNAATFGATRLAGQARMLELDGPQPGGVDTLRATYAETEASLKEVLDDG